MRFIEFLGLLAGLFIVFASTNPSTFVYFPFGLPVESVFVLMLIDFIAYSLFVYAVLYNIVILIPMRKIMWDEPLKVEIQEGPKETAPAPA